MNNELIPTARQEIKIFDRSHLTITGVEDVHSFDDRSIILKSNRGMMAIDGEALRISDLSVETGVLHVEGNIGGVLFFEPTQQKKKRGFFR